MSTIPTKSRDLVKARAHHRCERCEAPAYNGDWHHRRTRSVDDEHQHCPCNGVWLCRTCHRWAHDHPDEARRSGWIVSRWVNEPGTIPVHRRFGLWRHDCHGTRELSN